MRDPHSPTPPPNNSTTSLFAWHGWRLSLPRSWNPVKIDGDWDKGSVLFADLDHPRLGVRWRKIGGRKFDPAAWAQRAMRAEVGQLALKVASQAPSRVTGDSSLLYLDDDPPGRDVWIGYSSESRRAIEIIYHARRRDRVLAETLLPTLAQSPVDQATAWSIFDLSCQTPPGFRLASHRLVAGDLTLNFSRGPRGRDRLTLRQIAVAQLALSRRHLSDWLVDQQQTLLPHYRPAGTLREIKLAVAGRELDGFARDAEKLKRFILFRRLVPKMVTFALHDPHTDRLLIFQGNDDAPIEALAATLDTTMQDNGTADSRR
jgi:hypothetical protein